MMSLNAVPVVPAVAVGFTLVVYQEATFLIVIQIGFVLPARWTNRQRKCLNLECLD